MVLMLLAPIINRSYDMVSAMAASAVIILLQKPFAVYSCSFLLSFGAVVGIVVVYPVLKSLYKGRPEDINGYNLRIKYIQKFEKIKQKFDIIVGNPPYVEYAKYQKEINVN